jgi:hypothetical protein
MTAPVDRGADPLSSRREVAVGEDHVPGTPGVKPAGADASKRECDQVREAGGGSFAAVPGQQPEQDMPAVLGLYDGVLNRMSFAAGRLVPPGLVAADVPALHLDDRDADARPTDDKVGLILGGALDHRHRVLQRRVSGELVAQDLPDLPLGRAARAEPGLRRIATRPDRILPQPPCRRHPFQPQQRRH